MEQVSYGYLVGMTALALLVGLWLLFTRGRDE